MLAIRMQRTGRKGHAMFRVVVQDSRVTPTSGKIVALLGSYDPHTKALTLDKEKATAFLGNGAQPSDRAARLLQGEGIKLPNWVSLNETKVGTLRNPDKLRKNQPKKEPAAAAPAEPAEAETAATEETPAAEAETPAAENEA